MAETVDSLKKELEHYKKKLSLAEHDVAIGGYMAYVNLVRQQVDFIKDFQVKEHIDGKKSETVLYERAISMGESLPKMITSMNNLKLELEIEFDANDGVAQKGASSPQSFKREM